MKTRRIQQQRGVALVLTLSVLSVLSLIVIGFLVAMRTEQAAARNSAYVTLARQVAQAGIDNAIFMMRTNMPALSPTSYYVTQPGRAVCKLHPTTLTELFSTDATGLNTVDLNADNAILFSNATYNTATARQITAGWVNICSNGAASGTAPLIGRFAFWVDDEAAKVNINTALYRANTNNATPADVDLSALPGIGAVRAVASYNYAQTNGFFTTEQWLDVSNATTSIGMGTYSNNAFYITAYGKDDNLTPWGAPRLNLNATNFTAISSYLESVNAVLAISNYLDHPSLANWFGSGQTFTGKYGNVAQMAANIVDWIDSNSNPLDSSSNWQDTTPPSYLGLEVTPYLNELRIVTTLNVIDDGLGTYTYNFNTTTDVELWNMYGTSYSPNVGTEIYITNRTTSYILNNLGSGLLTNLSNPVTITAGSGVNALLNGGSYSSLSTAPDTTNYPGLALGATFRTYSNTVIAIYRSPQGRIDYAKIPLPQMDIAIVAPAPGSTNTYVSTQAMSCNDPRVKPVSTNWFSAAATLGAQNGNLNRQVVSTNGTAVLIADGVLSLSSDASCHTNENITRDKGRLDSLGELGYIHTGWPWRTLILEPQPSQELPPNPRLIADWIVLDLFSVTNGPVSVTNLPVVGRININAGVTNLNGAAMAYRLAPLQALFTQGLGSGVAQPDPSTNIYLSCFSANYLVNPPPPGFFSNALTFVGQVCEVNNFTSGSAGSRKEIRERRIRTVANIITVRSSTFSVWALGQALQVTATSTQIVAEAKANAIVERYIDTSTGTSNVAFRTISFRYVTP